MLKSVRHQKKAWIDKWVKMTGERTNIDAEANNTYIVYEIENIRVKEIRMEKLFN